MNTVKSTGNSAHVLAAYAGEDMNYSSLETEIQVAIKSEIKYEDLFGGADAEIKHESFVKEEVELDVRIKEEV